MPNEIAKFIILLFLTTLMMKKETVKPTKRNKCDYCDELAVFKIKKADEPSLYLCKSCYKDFEKSKK